MTVHIAVDFWGGDLGVKMTLPSCLAALKDKQLKISAMLITLITIYDIKAIA